MSTIISNDFQVAQYWHDSQKRQPVNNDEDTDLGVTHSRKQDLLLIGEYERYHHKLLQCGHDSEEARGPEL